MTDPNDDCHCNIMRYVVLRNLIACTYILGCNEHGSSQDSSDAQFGGATSAGGDSARRTTGNLATTGGKTATASAAASGGQGATGAVSPTGGTSATGAPDGGRGNATTKITGAGGGNSTSGGTTAMRGSTTSAAVAATGGTKGTRETSAGGGTTAGDKTVVAGGGRSPTGGTHTGGAATSAAGGATGGSTSGSSDVVGATPPMGWNSWNTFGCNNLTEALIKGVADTFVSSGMKDVGYQYVNLDDCWMNGRDSSGKIQVNTTKFPSGMAALAQYIHDKGLKIGLYSTPGTKTCAAIYGGYSGGVGSLGKETIDAQTYASWGIDYLKYDKCTAALSGFSVMRDALKAAGRPIFYSINPGDGTGCVPGKCSLDLPKIANMWRIGFDINASWSSMIGLVDQNEPLYSYAGPGHWNDPDMLEVGKLANENEDRAHFSLWAIMAAPLLAGNDIRSMSATTKAILTNAEVIAVDQDPLGIQGHVVAKPGSNLQVWAKKLSASNTVAVVLLNRGTSAASITVKWSDIGIPAGAATVRDLWSHKDLGSFTDSYAAASVPSHGVVMLKVTGG